MSKEIRKERFITVVMPVYCEELNIEEMVRQVSHVLDGLEIKYEIILVDDGSIDKTWDIITAIFESNELVKGILLSRNFGKESALCAGLDKATGDAVIVMDSDLQHPPKLIADMVACWLKGGVDIVDAIKEDRGKEDWLSKKTAILFYKIFFFFSKYDLKGGSDYKLLDRCVVDAWKQMQERNLFFRGMSTWLGFRRKEIGYSVQDRKSGESGWSKAQLIRLAVTSITSYSSAPLHIVTILGGIFGIGAIIGIIHTLYQSITGVSVAGFPTVIILILIVGSIIMISLGIMGEYIARIFDETKGRPRYFISRYLTK